MKLFNTYILPKLEFNSPVWSPSLVKDIERLESIQKRYTKVAFNRCNIPSNGYNDRLQKIGYLSLQNRRVFLDLVLLYKIRHNLCDLNFNDYFIHVTTKYSLRCHSFQIRPKLKHKSSQFHHSFFFRTPVFWNKLPEHIIEAKSLDQFKQLLKSHFHNT